jgi:uncharacterized membrane protein YphA (DoxX/SURF4 family)
MMYVALSCRALLGMVFLVSGGSKVARRSAFRAYARAVRRLSPLSPALITPAALALIAVELAVVILLVVPLEMTVAAGFALAILLLVVFSAAVIGSLSRGERTPCQCFGRSATPLGWRHVTRNAALACVALLGLVTEPGRYGAGASGMAAAVASGLVLGWLVTQADQIAELLAPSQLSVAGRPPGPPVDLENL